jgi:antitoxin MazE
MQATVSKWGNSLALRLPRHVADQMRLEEGTTVKIEMSEGSITVTPYRKKFKLSELLQNEPKRVKGKSQEFDWGGPVGEEEW